MPMQVILLERVDTLGNLGDVVTVKPGYARNYLLPQNKALRATKDNIAYFELQKGQIEKQNEAKKKESRTRAKGLEELKVSIIRHAAEGGQLYGSVTANDIAQAISEQSKEKIERNMVEINQAYKLIGLFPITIALHPEVKIDVIINIARSEEEAKIQAKTGRAMIAEDEQQQEEYKIPDVDVAEAKSDEAAEKAKKKMLEEDTLEAEKEKAEEDAQKASEKEAKSKAKSEARVAKKEEAAAVAAADDLPEEEGEEAASQDMAESDADADTDTDEKAEEKKEA